MKILRPRPGNQLAWCGDLSDDMPTERIFPLPDLPVRSPGDALADERADAITPDKADRETLADLLEFLRNF